jgi:RNA polymerase sigma-70 factor (ECF subfamily)
LHNTLKNPAQLASRIEAGDKEAEEELVDACRDTVYLMLLKHTGDTETASDLCHETIVILLRKLRNGDLKKPESLLSYIVNTARFVRIAHYRKEKRFISRPNDQFPDQEYWDRKSKMIDRLKAKQLIRSALDDLAIPRDRELLRRYYIEDQLKADICDQLEVSSDNFDKVLYRAKKRMRAIIEEQELVKSILLEGLSDD